jgi:excisionase family DNA binding protein
VSRRPRMTPELPLAAAQRRLGRPGRPRKRLENVEESAGTTKQDPRENSSHERGVLARQAGLSLPPRLLDVHSAARYLGLSPWTVRDLLGNGTLKRVRVPLPGGRELRRILLDRQDLDRLVESWKA